MRPMRGSLCLHYRPGLIAILFGRHTGRLFEGDAKAIGALVAAQFGKGFDFFIGTGEEALGLGDDLAHSSLRFGLGRFTTDEQIDFTIDAIKETVTKLREMSPLWEMFKEGVDINSIEWAHH